MLFRSHPNASSCASGVPGYPRCLIVNEIGQIFWVGGTEAEQAKVELCKLLESPDRDDRFIAYHYLVEDEAVLDPDTVAQIGLFRSNPQNSDIICGVG